MFMRFRRVHQTFSIIVLEPKHLPMGVNTSVSTRTVSFTAKALLQSPMEANTLVSSRMASITAKALEHLPTEPVTSVS